MIEIETPILFSENVEKQTSPFTIIFVLAIITVGAVIALKKLNSKTDDL